MLGHLHVSEFLIKWRFVVVFVCFTHSTVPCMQFMSCLRTKWSKLILDLVPCPCVTWRSLPLSDSSAPTPSASAPLRGSSSARYSRRRARGAPWHSLPPLTGSATSLSRPLSSRPQVNTEVHIACSDLSKLVHELSFTITTQHVSICAKPLVQ